MKRWTVAAGLALAMIAGDTAAQAPFTLTSSSFADGGTLDRRYGGNNPKSPNCVGQNVSPALTWRNVPAGTTSLALVLVDDEGRMGAGVVHWVAYGIRPAIGGFAEGAVSKPGPDHVGGKGTSGFDYYMGPCPPGTDAAHHYHFMALATDLPPDALPAGLTRDELMTRVEGHAKGVAGLVGRFAKPAPIAAAK